MFFASAENKNLEENKMKKMLCGVLSAGLIAAATVVPAFAETKTPKIIVDERELTFTDQGPVIVPETGRTLIPLRFVLEAAGAKVTWDGENQKVTVSAKDNRNRVILKIGSDEMNMYYYPSIAESVDDVQKLDQAPIIMNDRTMIPVRAVLEGIGAKVDWDEDNYVINVTSREYSRYMRDMGVEGYDVEYPLSDGTHSFDKPSENAGETEYSAEKDLPAISISTETKTVKVGEEFDVYIDMNNIEKLGEGAFLSTMTATFMYDKTLTSYDKYVYVDGDEEHAAVMDATNPDFNNDSLKIVSIATLGLEETPATLDGHIAKVTFTARKEGVAKLSLSNRYNQRIGNDTGVSFTVDDKVIELDGVMELYIDTTPIEITIEK